MDDQGESPIIGATRLTHDQLRAVVRTAMREELIACGILASTPAEQHEAQADFLFLRRWRRTYDSLVTKVGSTIIVAIVGALIGLGALGFNIKFGRG